MSKLTIGIVSKLTIGLTLVISAGNAPAGDPHEVFEATVVAVGRAPGFHCGGAMALQSIELRVTGVTRSPLHVGDAARVPVLVCFAGANLTPIPGQRALYELDPARVKPGATIAFDIAPHGTGTRLAFPDELRVVP